MTMNTYAVVALFARTEVGASIARSEWPAHLTLVSNFAVEAAPQLVVETVRAALSGAEPIEARLGAAMMFGPNADIPVQLVDDGPFPGLHERLAEAVERLPRFVADEPQYWHEDYRPHITLRFAPDVVEGDVWPVRCCATALLTADRGTIIDVIDSGTLQLRHDRTAP
ncbi:2'-5' RNA ligase family protein [Leifsonia shinshuensis]